MVQAFRNYLYEFQNDLWLLYSIRRAPMREQRAKELLDQRSGSLEESTKELREFIDRASDAPEVNAVPLTEEPLYQRLGRLGRLYQRLHFSLAELVEGDVLDLELLNRVRDDLAVTEALSRALQESEF